MIFSVFIYIDTVSRLFHNNKQKHTVKWIRTAFPPPHHKRERVIIFYSQQVLCQALCNQEAPTIYMMSALS